MDIEQFRQSLTDPKRTKEELLTMRENALRKGREFASVAEEVLEQRFPGWNRVKSRHGGATPVDVTFLAQGHHFDTAKEAYIWLIERFIHKYPKPFIDLDWETVFLAKGPRALFFAKSVRKLFGERQHLADDPNKYHRLTNGWFA
jgi:hypothetical protein